MRKAAERMGLFLVVLFLILTASYAQEKPLEPGVLSLDGSVGVLDKKVDEGKSALEKALGISISGFLDASYTWGSNRPHGPSTFDNGISLRYFDQDHNKVVFNFFNLTLEKPEKDWGVGLKLVADFSRSAELLREATFWGSNRFRGFPPGRHGDSSAELREAFVTFTIPVGGGLQVKGGKFVTPLGTEIIPAPGAYNDNISRSFLFNFGVPLTHTGVLFTYPVLKSLSISAGPVTGWDDPSDNNSAPSFLGGISFTPADAFSFASNIIVGPEQLQHSARQRVTWSNVATIKPTDPLALSLEYTYGHEEKVTASLRDGTWQGVAAIASYTWTDRFNTALRGEFFRDSDGVRTFPLNGLPAPQDTKYWELTLTTAYKFTAKLVGRFEVRQDWANKKAFVEGSGFPRADKNQTTIALQAIYTY